MADNWIQGAINPAHKGAFTRKANAVGKSVGEYAQEEKHAPGITGRQARLAMTLRKFADGGVVTPQQPPQQMPAWQRIWQALMGREALRRASGEQPQAPPPQNTDYSIVRKAAEEAGKRNDEEQRLKNAQPKPFCDGGMVRPYR